MKLKCKHSTPVGPFPTGIIHKGAVIGINVGRMVVPADLRAGIADSVMEGWNARLLTNCQHKELTNDIENY